MGATKSENDLKSAGTSVNFFLMCFFNLNFKVRFLASMKEQSDEREKMGQRKKRKTSVNLHIPSTNVLLFWAECLLLRGYFKNKNRQHSASKARDHPNGASVGTQCKVVWGKGVYFHVMRGRV